MKDHQYKETNSTTKKPKKHGQDSINPVSFNNEPSKQVVEQSQNTKIRVFYKVLIVIAFSSMIFVGWLFMANEGEKSFIKEAGLSNYTKETHFALFTVHFNKSYSTEEHKSFKMAIYHQNHNEMVLRNLKKMGITTEAQLQLDDSANRELKEEELTTEAIAQGTSWNQLQAAYTVGCEGQLFCYLLAVNPNMDETTEEFFRPRRNNATVKFQYFLSLTGIPNPSVDWMQYTTYVKNQGSTTTCYLQVVGTVGEILMTKRLRDVPQDKIPTLIDEMKKHAKDPSKEISWPDHCVLDANIAAICHNLNSYDELKQVPHIPRSRTFYKGRRQTCKNKEELESNELYLDLTSDNFQDDLDKFFSNNGTLKQKYSDVVCNVTGFYLGQSNYQSPLSIYQDYDSWVYVPANNSVQLQLHLTFSPVTVVMYVCNPFDFKNFGIGVYRNSTECNETVITHTVVVVGYGETEKGEEYWELLNSYGSEWGYQGIIRLARNTAWDQYGGQNGILIKPAWSMLFVKI